MAVGNTTTGSLSDSLPTMIAQARIIREFEGVYQRTTDMTKLKEGTGLDWNEISLAQLAVQTITESTVLDNPQQIQDTLFTIEPLMTGGMMRITDRTYRRIASVVKAKAGSLLGNAMVRRKDEDYLATFAGFSTTASPGSATPLSFGHITAAVANIQGNATEPATSDIYSVLDPFHVKDIQDEIIQGVGTYTVPQGMTADVFRKGFSGSVAGSNVFPDGNITRNATPDSSSATHAREAVVMVQGFGIRTENRRRPDVGGGADEVFTYDEYALGERSAGNWAYRHLADATAPTS
jgi:hypothetical protein